jgi:hypothetical protein
MFLNFVLYSNLKITDRGYFVPYVDPWNSENNFSRVTKSYKIFWPKSRSQNSRDD